MTTRSVLLVGHRFECIRFGSQALILRTSDGLEELASIAYELWNAKPGNIEDVCHAKRELVIFFTGSIEETLSCLQDWRPSYKKVHPTQYTLPVCFDLGLDWEAYLTQKKLPSRKVVIDKLCSQNFCLSMLGFLPGFLYFNGLPEELAIKRKAEPVTKLPAGSIAIGGNYLGMYGVSSPGGWHVIGLCPLSSIDTSLDPPLPFVPGDTFNIQEIDLERYKVLQSINIWDYAERD